MGFAILLLAVVLNYPGLIMPSTSPTPFTRQPPVKTYVMHPVGLGDRGEARVYDNGEKGSTVTVSVLPFVQDEEATIIRASCSIRNSKPIGRFEQLPVTVGDRIVDGKIVPVPQPAPIQDVWGYSTSLGWRQLVDHGLAVVIRDKEAHKIRWCGELKSTNEGNPLPAVDF